MHTHQQIYQWNNTKMGKNTTFHIHVQSEPGYSPKYPEYVFGVIGLSLCRHGLDHILRQITNCDGRDSWIVAICGILIPMTLKTCSGYLGEYPGSLLSWIWKIVFLPILVLFQWYICLCVCISVIKPIIDVPRKPSWKGPILMWTCFLHLGVYPRLLWNQSQKLCFEPSQIATVTNCDTTVAFYDLSQFVIKAVTAQTESNNTENVFSVLGRVLMFTFDMNMKAYICPFWCYFTGISGSDVDVNIFSALRSIPYGTIDIILKSCILNRHKLRQLQIATLLLQFVICRNLWSRPWRGILTPITMKTCYGHLGEYPCSLLTWIWKVSYLPILVLFHWYIFSYVYQS